MVVLVLAFVMVVVVPMGTEGAPREGRGRRAPSAERHEAREAERGAAREGLRLGWLPVPRLAALFLEALSAEFAALVEGNAEGGEED